MKLDTYELDYNLCIELQSYSLSGIISVILMSQQANTTG